MNNVINFIALWTSGSEITDCGTLFFTFRWELPIIDRMGKSNILSMIPWQTKGQWWLKQEWAEKVFVGASILIANC